MATNDKKIIPAIATHPGSILKKELKARDIKQKDFAKVIGMPAPNLSELIKGKRNITESIAIKLEEALGIPFQNWMNLQNRYYYVSKLREELDEQENKALIEEQSLRSRLNIPALYKYFSIDCQRASNRLIALKESLSIDLNRLHSLETNTIGFFKRSDKLRIDDKNMRTWLLLAWSEATKITINENYSSEKARYAASLIGSQANEGILSIQSIKDILNNNGIIFAHIPKLEAAPIDAYSMLAGPNPAIMVTYDHKNIDKLAFDVIHEIGHIILHISNEKSYISIENDYSSQSKEENEADQFAYETLIPTQKWNQILSAEPKSLTPKAIATTIAREAKKNGISPSIAFTRYKHETHFLI